MSSRHLVRIITLLLMAALLCSVLLKLWYLNSLPSIHNYLQTYPIYIIGIIGIIVSDIINIFFALNYAFIMSLANNDNKGTKIFTYIFSVLCFAAHLVFGIMMLVDENTEVTAKRVAWNLQDPKDYSSAAGIWFLMFYYERNGIAPILVFNIIQVYTNLTIYKRPIKHRL